MDELTIGNHPTERPGGRTARVRHDVLRATASLLAERSWTDVSIAEISERSGVHKTTIYRRWPTREELILDALLADTAMRVPHPDTGDTHRDLVQLLDAIDANVRSSRFRGFLAATLSPDAPEHVAEIQRRAWAERLRPSIEILRRGVERGDITMPDDPGLVIELLVAPVYFRSVVIRREPRPGDHEALVDAVLQPWSIDSGE